MKILIIEDETAARQHLRKLVGQELPAAEVVGELSSVEESIAWFQSNKETDLVFLDVHLSDGSAFDLFKSVVVKTPIIFTTAYHQYAIEAFKVQSLSYIVKPVTASKLQNALDKYRDLASHYQARQLNELYQNLSRLSTQKISRKRFLVKIGPKLRPIPTEEIAYFYRSELVYLVTHAGEAYPINDSLDTLEEALDEDTFARLNRQYLVRITSISHLKQYFAGKMLAYLDPKAPDKVVISQKKAAILKERLNR